MSVPFLRRRQARPMSAAARAVAKRTPETLAVVRGRAQPAAVTIARLSATAVFAYLLALVLRRGRRAWSPGSATGRFADSAEDWLTQARVLGGEIRRVDEAFRAAEESTKLNPRSYRRPYTPVSLREPPTAAAASADDVIGPRPPAAP